MASRYDVVYLANLAAQAERYEDMVDTMTKLVKLNTDLTPSERNLLYNAYKKVTNPKRESFKLLSITEKEDNTIYKNETHVKCIQDYRDIIESDITRICNDVITLIDVHLIPLASSTESSVFYMKMKADYYRYMAEVKSGEEKTRVADESLRVYKEAMEIAQAEFGTIEPIRLGLALNMAVFYYEVMNSYEKAYRLAKETYDEAMLELDDLRSGVISEETKFIMKLLKDNITLWKITHLE